ncbi:MAG: stage II sporulation protein M [Bacillus sp. (in: firmicutes)]
MRSVYVNEYEVFLRYYERPFWMMLLVGFICSVGTYYVGLQFPEVAKQLSAAIADSMDEQGSMQPPPFQDFLSILSNNLLVGFMIILLGFIPIYGVPFIYGIISFTAIGVLLSFGKLMGLDVMKLFFAAFVPHGVIEVIPICYCVAVGMFINQQIIKKLFFRKKQTLTINMMIVCSVRSYVYVILPFFMLAAFVEAYITAYLSKVFL